VVWQVPLAEQGGVLEAVDDAELPALQGQEELGVVEQLLGGDGGLPDVVQLDALHFVLDGVGAFWAFGVFVGAGVGEEVDLLLEGRGGEGGVEGVEGEIVLSH
jgi:hypothetical protein